VLSINTRCIKVQGYTPAEILLGFNPAISRTLDGNLSEGTKRILLRSGDILEPGDINIASHIDLREENGVRAGERLARKQNSLIPRMTPGYRPPT